MILARITDAVSSQLGRNTLLNTGVQSVRWVVQAVYFVAIARHLGPSEYGAFLAVAAVANILAPFATWGMPDRIVRAVSREPGSIRNALGTGLFTIALCGGILTALLAYLAPLAFPTMFDARLVASVAAADLIGMGVVALAAAGFQAFERMGWHGTSWLALSGLRTAAAVWMWIYVPDPTALDWAFLYLLSSLAAAVLCLAAAAHELGIPRRHLDLRTTEWSDGFYYAVGLSSQAVAGDIDKTMLARLQSATVAGVYGVGYRAVSFGLAPVVALLDSTYGRFFSAGDAGGPAVRSLLRKLAPAGLGYAVLVGAALWAAAPLLVPVLGEEYRESVAVLRWLAAVPLLKTGQLLCANALTGMGLHRFRTSAQIVLALVNAGLNLIWIPVFGWLGAVWATLAYEGALGAALGGRLWRALTKESPSR